MYLLGLEDKYIFIDNIPEKVHRPTCVGDCVIMNIQRPELGRGGKDIYELSTLHGSELEWMTLSDKITNQRFDTVSMLIPDELTNCEE